MSDAAEKNPWDDAAWRCRARDFARSLGIGAEQEELVLRALTHRSLAEEAPLGDNERLEFLGDSVVALLVNEYLFLHYPDHAEGQLTRLKQQYVCEPSLALAARGLDLGPRLA